MRSKNTIEKAFASTSTKGANSLSSTSGHQSKKSWKTRGKKWEDKPNLGGKQNLKNESHRKDQSNNNDQNKGACKQYNKLHYGDCWFNGVTDAIRSHC